MKRVFLCLILTVLVAALPATATSVLRGIDLFTSQSGTAIDFSDNPLPPGFFCGSDPGFSGSVPLSGTPIAADKSLGGADTIIQRLNDVVFDASGQGSSGLQVVAICLKNNAWTDPCGTTWTVTARLDPAVNQGVGNITMFHSNPNGGTFNSSLPVRGEITFTSGNRTLGPAYDDIVLGTTGACWAHQPGSGGVTVSAPVTVDADCDGTPELLLNVGTSNFHPGWCPPASGSGAPTWTPIQHNGPHPVAPPRKCRVQQVPHEPQEVPQEPTSTLTTGEEDGAVVIITDPVPCNDLTTPLVE